MGYLESLLQQVRPDIGLDQLPTGDRFESEEDAGSAALAQDSPSPQPARQLSNQAPEISYSQQPGQSADPQARRLPSVAASDDQQADRLSSEVALLCLSAAGRESRYFGPTSSVSFSRIVSATMGFGSGNADAPSISHENPSQDHYQDDAESWSDARRDTPRRIPSPSTGARLTTAYFDNIHPQYPFLHEPTFRGWEKEFWESTQSGRLDNVSAVPLFFVLMVWMMKKSCSASLNCEWQC